MSTRTQGTSLQAMAALNDLPLELKYMIIDELSATQPEVTDTDSSPSLLASQMLSSGLYYIDLSISLPKGAPRRTRPAEELRQIRRMIEQGTTVNDLACLAKANKAFCALVAPYIAKAIKEGTADNTAQCFFLQSIDFKYFGVFLRKLNPIGRSRIKNVHFIWHMSRKGDEAMMGKLTDATTFALLKQDCPSLVWVSVQIENLSRFRTGSGSDIAYNFEVLDDMDGFKECLELEQCMREREGGQLTIANMARTKVADLLALIDVLQEAREKYGLSS